MSCISYEKFWRHKSKNYVDMARSRSILPRSQHPSDDYVHAENIRAILPEREEKPEEDNSVAGHPGKCRGPTLQQSEAVMAPDIGVNGLTNGPRDSHPAALGNEIIRHADTAAPNVILPSFWYKYWLWYSMGTEHIYATWPPF